MPFLRLFESGNEPDAQRFSLVEHGYRSEPTHRLSFPASEDALPARRAGFYSQDRKQVRSSAARPALH